MYKNETNNTNEKQETKSFRSIWNMEKWKKFQKRNKVTSSAPSTQNTSTIDEREDSDFEYSLKASDDSDGYSLSEESEHEKGNLSFENILESRWIADIDNKISCNVCKIQIVGKWFRVPDASYIHTSRREGPNIDFCEKCAEKYKKETRKNLLNIIEKDTKLMRAIRLQECDLAFDCLERSRKGLIRYFMFSTKKGNHEY